MGNLKRRRPGSRHLAAFALSVAVVDSFGGITLQQVQQQAQRKFEDKAAYQFARGCGGGDIRPQALKSTTEVMIEAAQQTAMANTDVLAHRCPPTPATVAIALALLLSAQGFGIGPMAAAAAMGPSPPVAYVKAAARGPAKPFDIITEVEKLEQETEELDRLQAEARKEKERAGKGRAPEALPFVEKKEDLRLVTVGTERLGTAKQKIRALEPYLDETEYLITARKWDYLTGLLGVFTEQEEEFVDLIDGLYPTRSAADDSAREAMQFEAQEMFLAVDDLHQASKYKRVRSAEGAYARLALAYDRFLKAGNLLPRYDPITSTEPFFKNIPDEALRYDRNPKAPPKSQDQVLILRGPDKGRTGRVIGVIKSRGEGVVKVDGAVREVKLLDLADLGKLLPDA